MEIYKQVANNTKQIVVTYRDNSFIIGWWCSDIYWIMSNYIPNNSFIVKEEDEPLFTFFYNLFKKHHFNNNTFTWLSEARTPEESSSLKITKGKNYFKIRFIQGEGDYLAKACNICPICFCLSGSRNEDIANSFSLLLHELLNRD